MDDRLVERVLSQLVPVALLAALVFVSYYDRAEAGLAAPATPGQEAKGAQAGLRRPATRRHIR